MPNLPALQPGGVAVITGAASGIGLAAAIRFAQLGLKVALADHDAETLARAATEVAAASAGGPGDVLAVRTDVAVPDEVDTLRDRVVGRFGPVSVLMNNAGIEAGGRFFSPVELWRRIIDVNLWGAIHGVQAFVPGMIASGRPGLVINTGSKQGITTPPGNTPYNVSKAGLKVVTEALAHELRQDGCPVSAHLLIPGFVYTGLTRARGATEKPAGAWTPEQTVDFMLEALGRGDFYILCPDNDVDRPTDEKRMRWAADDIIQNRSALSRWDPRYTQAFEAYMKG
ncbi:MAG: hypothetical protein JWR08_255 [Enterovirga sp.]|nr:hypothetical protein [Enterovirga sp.]